MKLSKLAVQSLLYEAVLTPKPGLVDAYDPGSHSDMDIFTFIDSSLALEDSFEAYYNMGRLHSMSAPELFQAIRYTGMDAEAAMFEATHKINTHKGANFSFGIVLAAMGACHRDGIYDLKDIRTYIMAMTQGLVARELENLDEYRTHGEQMYLKHNITGIRGEVESGFPIIFDLALPYYLKQDTLPQNERLLKTLLTMMVHNDDSNILKRGGFEGLEFAKAQSQIALNAPDVIEAVHTLNKAFIEKNLSPGGSADLLALTHFLAQYTIMTHH